jgi:hypothetical protein
MWSRIGVPGSASAARVHPSITYAFEEIVHRIVPRAWQECERDAVLAVG